MGITSVLDLLDHYPRRYVDRTEHAEIAELSIGDEATVDAEVRSIRSRRTRDGKRTIVNAVVYDGTGLLELVFFNQAWRERQLSVGTQVSLFGKVEQYRGKRQLTNPVVDVLSAPDSERGAGDGPDATGTIVPVYPQSGKAEVHTWQLRRAVASALQRTKAKGFADPLDGASPIGARSRRPHARVHEHPPSGDGAGRVDRRAPAEVRRVPPDADRAGHAQAQAGCGSARHPAPDRRAARARVPRRPSVRAHRRPDARDRRDHRRPRGAVADAPAAAGRGRFGQDRRRAHRAAHRGPGRLPGRVHGADGSARRTARAHDALDARRAGRAGGGDAARRAAGAGGVAHEPHERGGAAAHHRRPDERRRRHRGGHARADLRRRRVLAPRGRGDRRAAPVRRGAARPAPREGRGARRAGDDGDTDSAHRGHAHLRRPRQDRAARAARRAARRSSPRWWVPAPWSAPRCTSACGSRSRRGARRMWSARSSKAPTSSKRAPRPRSSSGSPPRSCTGFGSGCSTDRCRRPTKRRRWRSSAPATSTCWSRRP